MNIKDACRYANYLDSTVNQLGYILQDQKNWYDIQENHLRSKANKEAADEIIDATPERDYEIKMNDLAYLVDKVMDESLALSLAINEAKKNCYVEWVEGGKKLSLDSAIQYNKKQREFAKYQLARLTNVKPQSTKQSGRDYMINVEGNQTTYNYTIETEKKVTFDKTVVRNLYKKILEKTDKVSTLIDEAQLRDIVNHTPKYDIHDTLEDIIAGYDPN